MSKERIDELEKQVAKIIREMEDQELVAKAIEHERSGLFKFILNSIKIITAIIVLLTVGDQAFDKYHWIKELMK
jgi:hypothetical protein